MVDFAKLHAEWYAGLDENARARVDSAREREARFEGTSEMVEASFERYGSDDGGKTLKVIKTWKAPVRMRIEDYVDGDGRTVEILAFKDAVTGHESYRLDEHLARLLSDPAETKARPEWYVCGGSLRYDSCRVPVSAIEAYVRSRRPELFAEAAYAP